MSRRRAIFLDVDGTYAHHGYAPQGHIDAIRTARANGHAVFLCTGRPVSILPDHLLAPGFDGIVGGAGAHVVIGGQMIADVRFPTDVAAKALELLDAADSLYLIETPEATYTTRHAYAALAERASTAGEAGGEALRGLVDIVAVLQVRHDLASVGITKITSFYGTRSIADVSAELGEQVAFFPSSIAGMGSGAGEIFLSHITKAVGLEIAARHLGIALEDTIAMGDNLNDLEMLEIAGTAVAMDDGAAQAIELADLVVPGPDREGLVVAFEQLGLLTP